MKHTRRLAALLTLLLALAFSTAALAEDWPAFIADHYPMDMTIPASLAGVIPIVADLPGLPLDGTHTTNGYTLRTHWSVCDGMQLATLFSLEPDESTPGNNPAITARLHDVSSAYGTMAVYQPEDTARTYFLMATLLKDENLGDTVPLTVTPQDSTERIRTIAMGGPDEIYHAPGGEFFSLPEELTVQSCAIEDGVLRVEYTLAQTAGDDHLYLVAQETGSTKLLSEPQYVEGAGTLEAPLGSDAWWLILARDTDETLPRALFAGWTLDIPLTGYAAPTVPLTRTPVGIEKTFAAPEVAEGENPILAAIEGMLNDELGRDLLPHVSVTLDEVVSFQCGALLLYTVNQLASEEPMPKDEFVNAPVEVFKGMQASWESPALDKFSTLGGVMTTTDANGSFYGTGYKHLVQAFAEVSPLAVTVEHPQFVDGAVRIVVHE